MTNHKNQLADELYETLNDVSDFIDFDKFPLPIAEKLDRVLKKYEQETTRGDRKWLLITNNLLKTFTKHLKK
jgi:hypothetical protein